MCTTDVLCGRGRLNIAALIKVREKSQVSPVTGFFMRNKMKMTNPIQEKFNSKNVIKADEGKNRLDLIEPDFILGLGEALTFGAKKYSDKGWKNIENKHDSNYASLMRHIMAWRKGEKKDPESGLNPLLHAAYNIMVLYYDDLQKEKK